MNKGEIKLDVKKDDEVVDQPQFSILARIGAAIFFCCTSVLIMIINKQCLTVFGFPSFQVLGLGQMITTIVVLRTAKALGIVTYPDSDHSIFGELMPLPLLYFLNMIFGLGGTKNLSLPMLTAMRRLVVIITLIGEYVILKRAPSNIAVISVIFMTGGAFVAAISDLSFDLAGYCCVMINNISSTGVMVFTKKKIGTHMGNKFNFKSFIHDLIMTYPQVNWEYYITMPHSWSSLCSS